MRLKIRQKISTKNIGLFLRKHATNERTLVIHSEDYDTDEFFPNSYKVTKRKSKTADLHVDTYYLELSKIESASFDVIVCTGLLEHLPNPQLFVDECFRILKCGGKIILQASSAFSVHEHPDNFFQFLPSGMKYLFSRWNNVTVSASCGPYETLAILAQRILLQTNATFVTRIITIVLINCLPFLDRGIKKSFGGVQKREDQIMDSMLASNIQVYAEKNVSD